MIQHLNVRSDRHDFGFVVEVIDRGDGVATSGDAQGLILDAL